MPDDVLGPTDRVLYLAAATTGKRQGELRALRWRDVGLGLLAVGKGNAAIELGALLGALAQLPDALLAQKLPDEFEPEPGIKFGWPRAGEDMPVVEGTVGVTEGGGSARTVPPA